MTEEAAYTPPKVWNWVKENGGKLRAPIVRSREEGHPVADAPSAAAVAPTAAQVATPSPATGTPAPPGTPQRGLQPCPFLFPLVVLGPGALIESLGFGLDRRGPLRVFALGLVQCRLCFCRRLLAPFAIPLPCGLFAPALGFAARPKSWYIDVCETVLDDEIAFLNAEIYLRDVKPRLQTLTAFTRFSARI